MSDSVFDAFRRLAYENAGITLRENKAALLSARVQKRMRSLGLPDQRAYLAHLTSDSSGEEMREFLDAISTNFTSFFREREHFEMLANHAERWRQRGAARIRLWCAASSTGEEPYTLAMTLAEVLGDELEFRILASDISTRALRHAVLGHYDAERVAPVPLSLRRKYFDPAGTGGSELSVRDVLRKRVLFKRINLATPPFPINPGLDAVFCRNVMIYFDTKVRQRLVSDFERLLRPGGLLVVAHSETLTGVHSELRTLCPSVYQKVRS